MTEEIKKQKITEEPDLHYLYIATLESSLYYPDEEDYRSAKEAWANCKERLFERVFETQGYRLNLKGFNHFVKGVIYGPLPVSTLNHIIKAINLVCGDSRIMFKIYPSGDQFKINNTFHHNVNVYPEEKRVVQWHIDNN